MRDATPLRETQRADIVVFADDTGGAGKLIESCATAAAKVLLLTGSKDEPWQDQAIVAGARGIVRVDDAAQLLAASTRCAIT